MRNFTGQYADNGKETRRAARERAGNKCIRCGHPNDASTGHVLTTHHFDGNKSNDEWWNLLALCQRCHLTVQGKCDPEIPYFLEHSDWIKPYVAGFYAKKYEGRNITREEAIERMDELLAYECRTGVQICTPPMRGQESVTGARDATITAKRPEATTRHVLRARSERQTASVLPEPHRQDQQPEPSEPQLSATQTNPGH